MAVDFRKLLRTYGPHYCTRRFTLLSDPAGDGKLPVRFHQILGGRRWSLAIVVHKEVERK